MPNISSVGATSMATELAVLLIENESNQGESERLQRESARDSYLANIQQQVEQLHEAASASFTGALTGAAFTVLGGALQAGAAAYQFDVDSSGTCGTAGDKLAIKLIGDSGNMLGALAAPAKTLGGDAAAGHHQAQAKLEESQAEQAKWQAGDASTSIDKANKAVDKYLDLLQGIQRDEHGANNAIIGRI